MPRRMSLDPNDPHAWKTKGICVCGHPLTRHVIDFDYRPPDGADVCLGRANIRYGEAFDRALARGEASVCQCRHMIPFLLVADTRNFRRIAPPGDTAWENHPFNVGLETYVATLGGPDGLLAWRAPATCRYPGCEAEGVVMRYTDKTQVTSVWVCREHGGGDRSRLSGVYVPPGLTTSGFLARLAALEARLAALESPGTSE